VGVHRLIAINIKDGSVVNLEKVASGIMTPFWPAAESNQLCYQNKNGVYQLNLKSSESKVLLIKSGEKNAPIIDCLIKDGYSYIIKQSKNQSVVIIAKPGETKELGIINLPRLANYSFINSDSKWLNVLDNNNHKLMLIDVNLPWTSQYTLKNINNQANVSYWIDSHRLLYANDFEIWLYDTTTNKDTLLTRIGHTINNVFWHPSRNYIIFATDSNINSLELDNRERHNITKLLEMGVGKAEMERAARRLISLDRLGRRRVLAMELKRKRKLYKVRKFCVTELKIKKRLKLRRLFSVIECETFSIYNFQLNPHFLRYLNHDPI
jgi:hypothetical protein